MAEAPTLSPERANGETGWKPFLLSLSSGEGEVNEALVKGGA